MNNLSTILDKPPPSAIEAECAALGSMILDPAACDEVRDVIQSPEDFYKPAHAAVYEAILALRDRGEVIDMVKLTQALLDRDMLEDVGGVEYLTELFDSVPSAASAGYYAKVVAEKAIARRAIDLHTQSIASLYRSHDNPTGLLDSSVNRLIELRPSDKSTEATISEWLDEAMEDDRPRIQSGMHALDDIVGGFEMGTMAIVGARPAMGKTAWGVCAALNIARSGAPVGFVSAEMKARRIARRFVCADAQISTEEFERDKAEPAMQGYMDAVRELPLWIDETPGIHVDKVCSRIRRWHREHGIQVAIVDYMQLIRGEGESQVEKITRVCQQLQALSRETDISLVVLAQLNRNNTMRAEKRPTMADLKGSGEIEQAADYILLLHREDYYADMHDVSTGKVKTDEAEIIVEKNRDGRTGRAVVGWIAKCGVFASGAPVNFGI